MKRIYNIVLLIMSLFAVTAAPLRADDDDADQADKISEVRDAEPAPESGQPTAEPEKPEPVKQAPAPDTGDNIAKNLPNNRTPDHKLIRSMSAADGTLFEFSKLMSEVANSSGMRHRSSDHTAYARIYFNDLYRHGSPELKKVLAMLTFQLGKIIDQPYWSGAKKDVAVNILINRFINEIGKQITNPEQRKKAYEFHKHLQAAVTPAMRGLKERLKAMPWRSIVGTTVGLGAAWWALSSGKAQKVYQTIASSGALMQHASDSITEAKRQRTAFFQKVWHTSNETGKHVEYKPEKDFEKKHSPLVRYNTGKQVYEYKLLTPIPDKENPGEKIEWVEAPRGITDRAVDVLEGFQPLTHQLGSQMRHNANNQHEWFEAHGIDYDEDQWGNRHYRMKRFEVKGKDGKVATDQYGQPIYEMRYVRKGKDEVGALPDRNIAEKMVTTLNHVNDERTGTGRLVKGIAHELERSQRGVKEWKQSNGIAADAKAKWDKRGEMYFEGTVHSGARGSAPGMYRHYPDKSVMEKLVGAIDRLHEDGAPNRLVDAIGVAMSDSAKGYARHLFALDVTTDPDNQHSIKSGYHKYMDPVTKKFYWLKPVNGRKATDHAEDKRIYEEVSGTADLFRGIGALAVPHDKDIPLHGVAGGIADIMEPTQLKTTIKESVGEVLASERPKLGRLGRWILGKAEKKKVQENLVKELNSATPDQIDGEIEKTRDLLSQLETKPEGRARLLLTQRLNNKIESLQAARKELSRQATAQDDKQRAEQMYQELLAAPPRA